MTLEPVRESVAGKEYHPTSAKSLFRLRSNRSQLPCGWVLVSSGLGGKGFAHETVLIANAGSGEPDRYALPAQVDAPLLIRLPAHVRELTVSIAAPAGPPPAGSVRIVQLGPLHTVRELMRTYWGALVRDPALVGHFIVRAAALVRRHGLRGLRAALVARFPHAVETSYREWVRRYDTLSPADVAAIRAHLDTFGSQPRFSIILLATTAAPDRLDAALRAVRHQLYDEWELWVAASDTLSPACRDVVADHMRADPRIRTVAATRAEAAVRHALDEASGEFVAVLDVEGELAAHALYAMAVDVAEHHDSTMLYSDEDCIDADGERHAPSFKPDWNPDLLVSRPFVGQVVAYRTDIVRRSGGWRDASAGVAPWDLALRVSAAVAESGIRHLPYVLYHRYAPAGAQHAPAHSLAARLMLEEHFAHRGIAVRVIEGNAGTWRVAYPCAPPPLVSVIVPTYNSAALLRRCVESVSHGTDYPAVELLIIDNRSDDPATLDYLAALSAEPRVRVLRYGAPFNFSAINNFAAHAARGAVLALLNNDVEAITRDWLAEMVGHALRPEVGAVGALLLYPDGRIQHAGLVLGLGGVAGHAYRGCVSASGFGMQRTAAQDVSAVTAACLVLRADVYRAVDGFDESLAVAFNDVDLCLRIRERGYRIVWTPYARLYHHESASRGLDRTAAKAKRFRREEALMREHWGSRLDEDPAYNPNLGLMGPGFTLALPPRVTPPWRRS
jgi:GT2 family glycosyltransferase